MEKDNIKILLNTDVEKILQYTGQYSDFVGGKLVCEHCGSLITSDNIGLIKPTTVDGKKIVKIWCDNIDCITSNSDNDGR